MRTIRSIRRRVDPGRRADYLAALESFGSLLRERGLAKGFYVMESEEAPSTFWEFIEFADGAAAARAGEATTRDEVLRAAAARIAALEGAVSLDDSMWIQRL